ncbi:unnamed protein product [Mycena citricolor]|uniref:Uncharacterized protein n=1 Tax=Mycena citricolor TaxID=2018698 RepID=A0AAD2H9Z2_9AGAR|nr:unnamed protein product [Mycena citricolor]CAK5271844.1 unnamed protein product [Mycena citricolor]
MGSPSSSAMFHISAECALCVIAPKKMLSMYHWAHPLNDAQHGQRATPNTPSHRSTADIFSKIRAIRRHWGSPNHSRWSPHILFDNLSEPNQVSAVDIRQHHSPPWLDYNTVSEQSA